MHRLSGRFDLGLSDTGGAVGDLTLQVGQIHRIVIDQGDV
jgi:hypothetical protein